VYAGVPTENKERAVMRCAGKFRLNAQVRAVKISSEECRVIVLLEKGWILTVKGKSRIKGMIEVVCEREVYSVFEIDLLERGIPIKGVDSAASDYNDAAEREFSD
jgi:hypothetical protein